MTAERTSLLFPLSSLAGRGEAAYPSIVMVGLVPTIQPSTSAELAERWNDIRGPIRVLFFWLYNDRLPSHHLEILHVSGPVGGVHGLRIK